jgi:hypothetical protein
VIRPGPRWAVLVFPLVSLALCWEAFRPGYVLLPTAAESLPPWNEGAGGEGRASNPLMSDGLLLTLPARLYNHQVLRAGEIPFWNPHVFCGYPHLALLQNNTLYPLTIPFDLFDPVAGIGYSACLHFALAGLLMYAFLRRSGLGRGAAVVGGLAFELNGMFLVRLGAPSYLYSGTWLPLMLLGARALLDRPPGRAGWALPAGVALSVLGGHPQITTLAVGLTAGYFLWHAAVAARADDRARSRGRTLAGFALLVLLGLALAGYQLLPFLELLAHSSREAVDLEVYRRSATPPAALLQAVWPDVFGHPVAGTYWFDRQAHLLDGVSAPRYWAFNYTGQNLFTGVAPLALALLAAVRARRRADVALFVLAALGSLGIFFGTLLLDLAWAVLPGFRYSRPDRVLFVYMAAVAILAGHGFEGPSRAGEEEGGGPRLRLVQAATVVLLALIAWRAVGPALQPDRRAALGRWVAEATRGWGNEPGFFAQAVGALAIAASVVMLASRRRAGRPWPAALMAALVALPGVAFGWRYNPAQRAPLVGGTAIERQLLGRGEGSRLARILTRQDLFLPPNLAQLLGLDDVQGSSAAGLEPYLALVRAADPGAVVGGKYFLTFRDPRVADTPLLRMLAVEYVASDAAPGLPPAGVAAGPVALFHNPGFRPRFYVVPRAEAYVDVGEARQRLLAPAFDPEAVALLPASAVARLSATPAAAGRGTRPRVLRRSPHHIELDVDAPDGGVLVTAEAAYPGWESRLDGRVVETLLVNTAFRGVALPPGAHRVTMNYVPRSFHLGVALSIAAVAAAFVFGRARLR